MSFLPPIVDINSYNAYESKLSASVRWLIARVYDKDVPDKLRDVVVRDEQSRTCLSVAVQTALTNGSLYAQASARIFKDGALLQQRPGGLLQALAQVGLAVAFKNGDGQIAGQPVTESHLMSAEPFLQMAHIAMVDALMTLHVRSTCTIERAIEAVSRYTTVEDSERPLDSTDALLFWINKICLIVRDCVEKNEIALKGGSAEGGGGMIPEMEDLYEDICDGCCLATLVSFYHERELKLTEISFSDPMSMVDCQYNLLLIQRFCDSLPCNPWHFSTEDMLYMHESMQVNVNAFLADFFDAFEPLNADQQSAAMTAAAAATVSSPRRFVPIQAIPELRAANSAARPMHPPKTGRFPGGGSLSAPRPPRSMSVMSADSLAGARPSLPLSARLQQDQHWGTVTAFGQLPQQQAENGAMSTFAAPGSSPVHAQTQYARSDSLPAASIRLALEEKRREHERKKAMASTMTEAERAEKSKAAFFALMSKHAKNTDEASPAPSTGGASMSVEATDLVDTLSRKLLDLQTKVDQMTAEREGERMARATSQPSIYHDVTAPSSARPFSQSGGNYAQPYTGASTQNEFYFTGAQQQQPQQQSMYGGYEQQSQFPAMRSSLSNGVLNYLPNQPGQHPSYDAYGQPLSAGPMGQGGQNSGYYTMQPGGYHQQQMQQQPQYVQQQAYGQQPQFMQQQQPMQQYGISPMMHQSAHAAFSQHTQLPVQQLQQPMPPRPPSAGPLQQPVQHSFSSSGIAPPPQYEEALQQLQQQQQAAADGFRLHQNSGTPSRLDPPLELNRNLTNWGLTYRQGASGQRPARGTWENQTFIKSELDLVNQPDNVPTAEDQQPPAALTASTASRGSRSREETPASVTSTQSSRLTGGSESEGPPRDPSARMMKSEMQENEAPNGTESPAATGPGAGFVVEDDAAAQDFDKIADQRRQAKREALLAKTMKRKEEISVKVENVEARNAERRAAEEAKQAMAEQRKLEKEIQRQKILEEYKRRKVEKELGLDSARSVGRGSSQPPFARTKSQGLTDTPRGGSSSSNSGTLRARGQSNMDDKAKIVVPSCAEPTLKLFAKVTPKSNRNIITNALQYSVYPGAVSADSRNKVLAELAKSDSKHHLLLFRDHKCQYRGLYEWDQVSESCTRIHGTGPKIITEAMMSMMFKYDSGGKSFTLIPSKHLSATIDGFAIKDEYWQKSKIPHSGTGAPSHRDN